MNANKNSCSECACHLVETCAAGFHPLVGNGFCNDDTNIAECDYDGQDCCSNYSMVGDGICNDFTNIAECHYDGGDCCGYNLTSEHCTDCTCFHQETCLAGLTHAFVGDGVCNDNTNIAECDYDGGDCCVNVITDSCSDCNCLGGDIITLHGFDRIMDYDTNYDLTWLIQVQLGQKIEINFLSFEVYYHYSCR